MAEKPGARVIGFPKRSPEQAGVPPVRKIVRTAKIASLPVAYAGRQVGGAGKRAFRRASPSDIERDIQTRTAQHIFAVLGELKGFATKLGQLLSLYELALPPAISEPYRIALAQLQDSVPAMLPPTVEQAMAASMGDDWRVNFQDFDLSHASAASIGQVHHAIWRDGTPVAVKVMYPGARQSVLNDLEQLRRLAVLAPALVPGTDVKGVTDALCSCVVEELDYVQEAAYQRAFAATYADDADFVVPKVIAQRGDVLVTEWIEGTPLKCVLASHDQPERNRVGLLLLRFVLSSGTRTGYLYCDPHPGNFRVLADGRLGILDFGACAAWPPPAFPQALADMGDAIYNGDLADLEAAMRRNGFAADDVVFDVAAAAAAIAPLREILVHPTFKWTNAWLREQVLTAMDLRLSNVNRQLRLPAEFTRLARAVLSTIGVLNQLEFEGPVRAEILRWFPQAAEFLESPT
jgi:predicted unusual protein kinase regulating ubiquinone biosynthesis (AarF/ABC1/UbiB family)